VKVSTQDDRSAAQVVRSRDAARTRQALLDAARHRFAYDGYGATTSRDIAADVGVNVALINRYFTSKEGLFEACLARTVEELGEADDRVPTAEDVVRRLIEEMARPSSGDKPLQMLLLLRSSGDERADAIRRRTMQAYTERMAAAAGWRPDSPSTAPVLLRAQIAMAMAFGVIVMRTSSDLQPLAAATEQELARSLGEVLRALLPSGEA
jgi:AcrR family transcriptional regulator